MNAELAVLSILLNDATIDGLVSNRVYLDEAPQGDSLDYIIIETSDNEPFPTKSGVSAKDHTILNVFSYATDPKRRKNLANAVRSALDGQSGTFNSVQVEDIRYQTESGFFEELENRKAYVRDQEYLVRVVL